MVLWKGISRLVSKPGTLLLLVLLAATAPSAFAERESSRDRAARRASLRALGAELRTRAEAGRRAAILRALEKGWLLRAVTPSGGVIELAELVDGMPVYNVTENLNAARTSGADRAWPGGSAGYELSGAGVWIGEWDGGKVRTSHQEFTGRVFTGDTAPTISDHSTHVAGTILAAGTDANAKGLAYGAGRLSTFDWNSDAGEMALEAADSDLLLSNHSYGTTTGWNYDSTADTYYWYGDIDYSSVEDYRFGFYNTTTRDWDRIAWNAPFYLIVKSAGNDRNDGPPPSGKGHWYWSDTAANWVYGTMTRDTDGGTDGYDCIPTSGNAKNILTVGAVGDIVGGYTAPSDVVMTDFSSWGPTDDGRIKPDLVANGDALYSSIGSADNAYAWSSGTSMSAPATTGGLALLIQQYRSTHGNDTMRSSMLKALAVNGAFEAGSNAGPDYVFGWGLLNVPGSARTIRLDRGGAERLMISDSLATGQTDTFSGYVSYGDSPIRVTLCWTDTTPSVSAPSLNPRTKRLVNDLDLRVVSGATTYTPWVLDLFNPSSAATTGDNDSDNVERIDIAAPPRGTYSVSAFPEGAVTAGPQPYSIVISGLHRPQETHAVASGYRSIAMDGAFDFFETEAVGACTSATNWGASNDLDTLYVTYSRDTLYVGLKGTFNDGAGNYVVVFIDRDFGKAKGASNMSVLTDNAGDPDNAISTSLAFGEIGGFGADLALGWNGNAGTGGVRRFETAGKYGNFDWLDNPGDNVAQKAGGGTYVEFAVRFDAIYNDTSLTGNSIALLAMIGSSAGDFSSNQFIPDSALWSRRLAVVEIDRDSDGVPDNGRLRSITGKVGTQARGETSGVAVYFLPFGATSLAQAIDVDTTDNTGSFRLQVPLDSAGYIRAAESHHLPRNYDTIAVTADTAVGTLASLQAGDVTGDGRVTIFDACVVKFGFPRERADLDGDGWVAREGDDDMTWVRLNFGRMAEGLR